MKWVVLIGILLLIAGCTTQEDTRDVNPEIIDQQPEYTCSHTEEIPDTIYFSYGDQFIGSSNSIGYTNLNGTLLIKSEAKSVEEFLDRRFREENDGFIGKKYTRLKQDDEISCGQTAAASALKTYIKERTGDVKLAREIYEKLIRIVRPDPSKGGTNTMDLARGIAKMLNEEGIRDNMIEIKCENKEVGKGELEESGTTIKYSNGNIGLEEIMGEQIKKGQNVLLLIRNKNTGEGHFVNYVGARRVWNEGGGTYFYYIYVMDPWTGKIRELIFQEDLDGKPYLEWKDNSNSDWEISCYISISPDTEKICGNGVVDPEEECDPMNSQNTCGGPNLFCVDCRCEYAYWMEPKPCETGTMWNGTNCESYVDVYEKDGLICFNITKEEVWAEIKIDGKTEIANFGENCYEKEAYSQSEIHNLEIKVHYKNEEIDSFRMTASN